MKNTKRARNNGISRPTLIHNKGRKVGLKVSNHVIIGEKYCDSAVREK